MMPPPPVALRPGGGREIRLQVCVRPRGAVLDGVPRQSAAGAEDGHGAADQRGGHGAAVALRREHGLRPGGALLSAAPLQRRLRLLTSTTHTHTHTTHALPRPLPPPRHTPETCHVL